MTTIDVTAIERYVRDPKRKEIPVNMAIALLEEIRRLEREATTPRGRADGILLAVSIVDSHIGLAELAERPTAHLHVIVDVLRKKHDRVLAGAMERDAIDVTSSEI